MLEIPWLELVNLSGSERRKVIFTMNSAIKKKLKLVRDDFNQDLRPKYILPYMVARKIVTKKEEQEILSLGSLEEQIGKFFDLLSQMNNRNFQLFLEVLRGDSGDVNYPWLAEKLNIIDHNQNENVNSLDRRVYESLVKGGVPFMTNCFLPREEKIQAIRKALYSAKGRHWIVLYGMTGTGKSVLAAEALRDKDLINDCFSDGVFWVSVGKVKDDSNLILRMKKLFKLLNSEDKFIPSSEGLSDLTYELKNIVVSKKILVVLDDVWEQKKNEKFYNVDILKVFDIGCPILVTTKYQSVYNNFSQNCTAIEYKNDFSISEGRDLLALHLKCDSKDLPDEADWICQKCRGSPFTLSHIGRWMSSHGNVKKYWENLIEKLKEGPFRQRHLSGEESNGIKKIILSTLEPIEEYKDYFYDFVIFPEDVWVPSQVFEVLWNKDCLETGRMLYSLYQASLVQYEEEPSKDYAYGIHDIYLEILTELCSTDQDITNIEDRHERLINNYLNMCFTDDGNFDFSLLPKDHYIHYYLAYHIEKAGVSEFFRDITIDDIFFDLQFIQDKIHLDPGDLYSDYTRYRNLFKDKKKLEEFTQFASKVKNTVCNYMDLDIIQWGLFEPHDSFIYEKAFAVASQSPDKDYYKWCNQGRDLSRQTSKLNSFENMQHAALSSDCQLIACVGEECRVRIFSSYSGEELKVFTGHSATVNWCDFNASGSKLATASDDRTVRIFDVDIPISAFDSKPARKRSSAPVLNFKLNFVEDMSTVTFTQHCVPVLCCRYSPDEDLIISSDEIGCVCVWQSSTGAVKFRQPHNRNRSIQKVNYCCFDTHGIVFASSAYDTIKLWSMRDGSFVKEISHNEQQVMGICFSSDYIISVADKYIYINTLLTDSHSKIEVKKNLLISSCCVSPDGNWVACGTSDCTMLVYNLNTGKQISNLKGHRNDVFCVTYSLDGQKLLSASKDGYILHDISDIYNGSSLIGFEEHLSVRQADDDLIIAASNSSNCIEIRKGMSGQLYCKTDPDDCSITACSLSNDCTELVYGTKSGSLKVFNIENRTLKVLKGHGDQVNYIMHSKNNLFFTCSVDKKIKMWIDTNCTVILEGHRDSVVMCVPFKQRNHLLSCSKDGTLRVWDMDKQGKSIVQTEGHGNQAVRCCDVSFDEKYMASASADKTVKIYITENGSFFKSFECASEVKCCRFSPKFLVLVAGCDCGQVIYSQLNDKREDFCHQCCVSSILFAQDGSQYLTIADDIKIQRVDQTTQQTLTLPTSLSGISNPSIWASDHFDILVIIHEAVLYILQNLKANVAS